MMTDNEKAYVDTLERKVSALESDLVLARLKIRDFESAARERKDNWIAVLIGFPVMIALYALCLGAGGFLLMWLVGE